jgi:peptidyl-prolyl cis-trans isomerase C
VRIPLFAPAALFGVSLVIASGVAAVAKADPANDERRSAAVAKVGNVAITVGQLEDRLAGMPAMQLALYGSTVPAAKAAFLKDEMVREELLVQGAQRMHLEADPRFAAALRRARADGALRAVRAKVGTAASLPQEEVARYFEAHRDRYDQPERILLWRILVGTKAEADTVLAAAKKEPTPATFQALAREHSLDKATYLRGGYLGFIAPDGGSSEVGLRVDAALFKAASAVKDGELVATPVPEGSGFAVVWRRGTLAARRKTLADVAPQIRETLQRERMEAATAGLIASLRNEHLRDVDDSLLKGLVLDEPDERPRPAPSAK